MEYFKGQAVPAHKTTIMIHCLATSRAWGEGKSAQQMVEIVNEWHTKERGWSAIGYAGIIDYQGRFAPGRDLDGDGNVLEETAAAARGWNKDAIHIALAGGRGSAKTDLFRDHYTFEQDATLRAIIAEINAKAGRQLKLMGHNEVAAKACPGFDVNIWHRHGIIAPRPPEPEKPQPPWTALIASIFKIMGGKK